MSRKKKCQDSPYKKWIKGLSCVISCRPDPDPHHVNERGHGKMAGKCDDSRLIPLNHEYHVELHNIGRDTFEKKYGLDYELIIETLNRTYTQEGGKL